MDSVRIDKRMLNEAVSVLKDAGSLNCDEGMVVEHVGHFDMAFANSLAVISPLLLLLLLRRRVVLNITSVGAGYRWIIVLIVDGNDTADLCVEWDKFGVKVVIEPLPVGKGTVSLSPKDIVVGTYGGEWRIIRTGL